MRSSGANARAEAEPGKTATGATKPGEVYFDTMTAGGFQVPSPSGKIDGALVLGQ